MKIKALYLKSAIELCSRINPDIFIYQDKDKLVFQVISEDNSSLLQCDIISNITKSDKVIYFPSSKIRNILSAASNDDNIEIIVKDEYILFKLNNITRTVRLTFPDKPRFVFPDERTKEQLVFTHDIDLFKDELVNTLIASNDLTTDLTINIKDNKLELKKEDNVDEFSSILKNIKVNKSKESISNRYNSDFIYQIVSKAKDKIKMQLSQDAPIKFTNQLYRNFTFKHMVAPLSKLD